LFKTGSQYSIYARIKGYIALNLKAIAMQNIPRAAHLPATIVFSVHSEKKDSPDHGPVIIGNRMIEKIVGIFEKHSTGIPTDREQRINILQVLKIRRDLEKSMVAQPMEHELKELMGILDQSLKMQLDLVIAPGPDQTTI
jgi:hypothetical protein